MAESSNPQVTDLRSGASTVRLILRITPPNALGEQESGPTTVQVVAEGIDGNPNGRSLGSPGDVRIRRDVPQIWQKLTGVRTTTGWGLLGAVGPQGPIGPQGPVGPQGPQGVTRDTFTFTANNIEFLNGTDLYFGFSAGVDIPAVGPPSTPTWIGTMATLGQMSGGAAEKLGPVSGPSIPIGVSLRSRLEPVQVDVWTEVGVPGMPFVRTVQAAGLNLLANTIAVVPFPVATPFGPGDRFRCGIRAVDSPGVLTGILAELEIG